MAINATNNGVKRELIPAGNYIARCYQMIEIGTIDEEFKGEKKKVPKIRIGWEFPTELKVFKEEKGLQPLVISKEFSLFMNEKANLRKVLASWRGKDFTNEEATKFDVSVLIGKTCMLNLIHKPSVNDPTKIYEEIGSISPMPKGIVCPEQINPTFLLSYDNFDYDKFNTLPEFIRTKMQTSKEYLSLHNPEVTNISNTIEPHGEVDDLPF
jgi:hypothetical protein